MNKPRGWIYGARWAQRTVEARVVKVMVGPSPKDWWCADMVGQERPAIEIKLDGQTVYVDNEDGRALAAMLKGVLPIPGTRFVPVFYVLEDEDIKMFYKATPDGCA